MKNKLWFQKFAITVSASLGILILCSLFFFYVRGAHHILAQHKSAETLAKTVEDTSQVDGSAQKAGRPIIASAQSLHVSIFMYHHVGDLPGNADRLRHDLTVSRGQFLEQVAWLKNQGYESITLDQVYQASQKKFALPDKPVVFKFDDGYRDAFEVAAPILKQHGYKGSFAVVPEFVGRAEYASWEQIVSARNEGMEIVSHTYNHFDGGSVKYSEAFIQHNLELSLAELDMHLGKVPRILIYPYGHYTPQYVEIAEKVGFVMALTTAFGQYVEASSLMLTPRVRVHGGEPLDRFMEIIQSGK